MSRFFVSMIALPLMLIGLATTPVTADMDQKDRAEMQQVIEHQLPVIKAETQKKIAIAVGRLVISLHRDAPWKVQHQSK